MEREPPGDNQVPDVNDATSCAFRQHWHHTMVSGRGRLRSPADRTFPPSPEHRPPVRSSQCPRPDQESVRETAHISRLPTRRPTGDISSGRRSPPVCCVDSASLAHLPSPALRRPGSSAIKPWQVWSRGGAVPHAPETRGAPSSSGPGRRPLTAETGVRFP